MLLGGVLLVVLLALSLVYRAYPGMLREQRDVEFLHEVSMAVTKLGNPRSPGGAASFPVARPADWQPVAELDNRRLLRRLHHDAYHDPLTGLLNRLGFIEYAGARLTGPAGAVLVIDLDALSVFRALKSNLEGIYVYTITLIVRGQ